MAALGKDVDAALDLYEIAVERFAQNRITYAALTDARFALRHAMRRALANADAQRATASPTAKASRAWMLAQIQAARDDIATWPQWMRDAAYFSSASPPTTAQPGDRCTVRDSQSCASVNVTWEYIPGADGRLFTRFNPFAYGEFGHVCHDEPELR